MLSEVIETVKVHVAKRFVKHENVLKAPILIIFFCHLCADTETAEETSSSSENSPSNVSRKHKPSYQARKSAKASAMMKRHMRSSSGYSSSHNEETTFRWVASKWHKTFRNNFKWLSFYSIANYPGTYKDICPPSRFSDVVGGEPLPLHEKQDKKTSSSPRARGNPKFQREAFQINVWTLVKDSSEEILDIVRRKT